MLPLLDFKLLLFCTIERKQISCFRIVGTCAHTCAHTQTPPETVLIICINFVLFFLKIYKNNFGLSYLNFIIYGHLVDSFNLTHALWIEETFLIYFFGARLSTMISLLIQMLLGHLIFLFSLSTFHFLIILL